MVATHLASVAAQNLQPFYEQLLQKARFFSPKPPNLKHQHLITLSLSPSLSPSVKGISKAPAFSPLSAFLRCLFCLALSSQFPKRWLHSEEKNDIFTFAVSPPWAWAKEKRYYYKIKPKKKTKTKTKTEKMR